MSKTNITNITSEYYQFSEVILVENEYYFFPANITNITKITKKPGYASSYSDLSGFRVRPCVCSSRSLRTTFEEAPMPLNVEVWKYLGPTKCPLTQKCTRSCFGTPKSQKVTVIWEIERSVFWTRLHKNAHGPVLGPLNRRRSP